MKKTGQTSHHFHILICLMYKSMQKIASFIVLIHIYKVTNAFHEHVPDTKE